MSKNKRSWFSRFEVRRAKQNKPIAPKQKPRRLLFEVLEPRRVLSAPGLSLAAILAQRTPNPQPSGDVPADISQLMKLTTYAQAFVPPDMPGIQEIHEFVVSLQQIFTDIANNPDARPAYWGEYVAGAANQYRLHLDDNGMLITSWTINWGDGTDPQVVAPSPWVVHQYAQPGSYTVCVTAQSPDGTFTAVGGDPPIDGVPPTLHVAGPQTVALGSAFALDNLVSVTSPYAATVIPGTTYTEDYSYDIDLDDGSTPITGNKIDVISAGGNGAPFMGALRSDTPDGPLARIFNQPGTYDVSVTVTNNTTGASDTQVIPVTVLQLAPTINVNNSPTTSFTCNEGDPVDLSATVSADPSLTDPVGYNWQIVDSWGNTVFQSTDPTPSFTFTAADTYTVSLVTSIDNVQSALATATITVNDLGPSFVDTSTLTATVSSGQPFNLTNIAFTNPNPQDTDDVTVNWDTVGNTIPLDTGAQLTEETSDGSTIAPGTINDSYTYTLPSGSSTYTYYGTITLTDSEGTPATKNFQVTVVSADVALTAFTASSGHTALDVSYTVANADAGAFTISIYASTDGVSPDHLLQSFSVSGTTLLTETTGTPHTVSITPDFTDVPDPYHLIAVTDANPTTSNNTIEFAGGIFVGTDSSQSPPQTTLYVFGTPYEGTGTQPTDVVTIDNESGANHVYFGSTDYTVDSSVAAIHFRAEGGIDTVTASPTFPATPTVASGATAAMIPLWLFGGSGTNTLVGGAASNLVVGGSGTNVTHDATGTGNDVTVDDSDTLATFPNSLGYYSENVGTGDSAWSSDSVAEGFNQGQREHATSSISGTNAVWTFGNLDPTSYYDAYVTWTPPADPSTISTHSQYTVVDGSTTWSSLAIINQQQPPADEQADGTFWHYLGTFPATSGTLVVQLGVNSYGTVLADAARIVPHTAAPVTNLSIDDFSIDSSGNLSVTYTVTGEDAPPFSIGIYGSPDGRQTTDPLQSYQITDPSLLGGGGTSYTVSFPAELGGLAHGEYVIAKLDCFDEVYETDKADNTSTALSGVVQSGDGSVQVLGSSTGGQSITLSQGDSTGISVNYAGQSSDFESVSAILVNAYKGANTIDATSVTEQIVIYGGVGGDNITGGAGDTTIYGGLGTNTITAMAGLTTIYSQGVNNQIYGGSGDDTIYAGNSGDTITGSTGNDTIYGGLGNDLIRGGSADNWIQAGGGNDTIYGGPTYDYINGGSGNDSIFCGTGQELVYTGNGNSTITGGTGYDDFHTGTGTNMIYGNGLHDLFDPGSSLTTYVSMDQKIYDATPPTNPETFTAPQLSNLDVLNFHGPYNGLIFGPFWNPTAVENDYGVSMTPGLAWSPSFDLTSGDRLSGDNEMQVAVYVNWDRTMPLPSTGDTAWTTDAYYAVYDGGTEIGRMQVDQSESCPYDLAGYRAWKRLVIGDQDTFTIYSGHLTVAFCFGDPNNSFIASDLNPMYVDAVLVQPLWPGTSILPDVNLDGAINAQDQVAKQHEPLTLMQGNPSRTQVDLNVTLAAAFADQTNWQARLFVTSGASYIQLFDSATGGSPISLGPDGFVENWSVSGGQASITIWVQAASGSIGSGTLVLQAVNTDTLTHPPVVFARDKVNFTTKQQQTTVVVVGTGGVLSENPSNAILTDADWQWIAGRRAAYLASLRSLQFPSATTPGDGSLQACITNAQQNLATVNAGVAQLAMMEANPGTTAAAYRVEYLNTLEAYDNYTISLIQVTITKAKYLSSFAYTYSLYTTSNDPLIAAANSLPTYFVDLLRRGMTLTVEEKYQMKKADLAVRIATAGQVDSIEFTKSAIVSIGVGVGAVAAFATLTPVAAVLLGGTLLIGGTSASLYTRISRDNLSGSDLITSTISDVSGFTALGIGLSNIDPVTHEDQGLSGSQRGWQFGIGFTALCTFTYQGAKIASTIRVNWVNPSNPALQSVAGDLLPNTAYAPAAIPLPTANIGVATINGPGGMQVFLMTARPGFRPYVNNNPKAKPGEINVGTLLDEEAQGGNIPGVKDVEGAAEIPGKRSGDYRLELDDGTEVSGDLYQPQSGDLRSIRGNIIEKSGQADVVVVEFGAGATAGFGEAEAQQISESVLGTPGHGIKRLIFVKDGSIIFDTGG